MPIALLDLIVIGVVLISSLLASVRGFTREVLAIVSWIAAAIAALYLHPFVLPHLEPYISNPTVAQVAAIAAVFIVTLVLVSFVTVQISDLILDSRIGAVDRSLGFVFGAARGILICAIAFLFFNWLVKPEAQPEWARDAKSRPLLQSTGDGLLALLPADFGNAILQKVKPQQAGDDASPADADPGQGSGDQIQQLLGGPTRTQ
ncbi:membrane protein required for colicin V production [Pseudochelatococcus lubricantis]|uniref:Membrane protein required for colicin V production n=1 Tax=Pseudochelatococcus lubricantis TaxID=1538102 RepID=A0ABX0V288_9HYPH|nr:CvpA family protein [Pseudochelatococcus lubricantis]NIJ59329.1 membrane protein required for colicin V production [Pseudochelatococcus lubricantis]